MLARTLFLLCLPCMLAAQIGGNGADGTLVVNQGVVTLDTSLRPDGFHFTAITVAAGAELRLVGVYPARRRSQGPVTIDGLVNADGFPATDSNGGSPGPGGFWGGAGGRGTGGTGQGPGGGCGGMASGMLFAPPGGASHATPATAWGCGGWSWIPPPTYGSAWPFDTRGGSGSGGYAVSFSYGGTGQGGSGGGGTVIVSANGPLFVGGRISARGASIAAAGSILLQSTASIRIQGSVDASGAGGGSGWIRLDAHGDDPVVVGVTPSPMIVVLPRFGDVPAPAIGVPWTIRLDAWPGDVVAVWLSLRSANLPFPPFGILRLDPTAGLFLAGAAAMVPSPTGLEASGSLTIAIPNDAQLRGLTLHAQGLNAITGAANPRFTELRTVTIQ